MGCSNCKRKNPYYLVTQISSLNTIRLKENVLVTSMLELQDNVILCGYRTGVLSVYKIDENGANFTNTEQEQNKQHDHLVFSLCKLSDGKIISASLDKLVIWEFASNNLNKLAEYQIDGDIDKVIGLNGGDNKFAVGYIKANNVIISIYEYNSASPSQDPIKHLTEEQEDTETALRSMIHLNNRLLVSSCKNSSQGRLSFWDIDEETVLKTIPGLCTNALNGLSEVSPNLLVVASSNGTFVVLELDTYTILKIIEDDTKQLFHPQLISFSIFKKESLLYVSDGKCGQLLIRGAESKLTYFHKCTEKFRGNGIIISPNEKFIVVDNDVDEDNNGAISILSLDFMQNKDN